MIKLSRTKVAVLMLILLLSLTGCGKTADGKTHLTFQIWDAYQSAFVLRGFRYVG